jgi:hypothetical protein
MVNPDIQETQRQEQLQKEVEQSAQRVPGQTNKKDQIAAQVTGQGELPFALIQGEPLTVIPQDLYIPPNALEVILEAFEGPLDLLLYLIKRQNIDILEIPLEETTRQYMHRVNAEFKNRAGSRISLDGSDAR